MAHDFLDGKYPKLTYRKVVHVWSTTDPCDHEISKKNLHADMDEVFRLMEEYGYRLTRSVYWADKRDYEATIRCVVGKKRS